MNGPSDTKVIRQYEEWGEGRWHTYPADKSMKVKLTNIPTNIPRDSFILHRSCTLIGLGDVSRDPEIRLAAIRNHS